MFSDTVRQEHFFYNVSYLQRDEDEEGEEERILEAEFHIFKLKPRPARSAEPIPPHQLQVQSTSTHSCNRHIFPSLISLMVSVDVKHHFYLIYTHTHTHTHTHKHTHTHIPVPNKPYGFCGRKEPRKKKKTHSEPVWPNGKVLGW